MNSKILIRIKKENEVQNQTVISEEFITDLYIYTVTPKMSLLFHKEKNQLFEVKENQLFEMKENTVQIQQINQLKEMISSLDVKKEITSKESTSYQVDGKGNAISIVANVTTKYLDELAETANFAAYQNSQKNTLFELNLSVNELVETSTVMMNIQGQEVCTKSKIIELEVVKENIQQFDSIFCYPFSQN